MPPRDNYNKFLEKVSPWTGGETIPAIDLENLFESVPASLISGNTQLTYLKEKPTHLENGMVWMESNGLHIYYDNVERTVAGS